MTRMPRDLQPLEPWGPEDRPDGFVWDNTEHRILAIVNTWVIHTLWWEPSQTVWREYFWVGDSTPSLTRRSDTGMLCVIYHDLLRDGWFLARIYD